MKHVIASGAAPLVIAMYLAPSIGTAQAITEIIDSTGDGNYGLFVMGTNIAVDPAGDVFVAAQASYNAFKITDPCGARVITEIIDPSGDGQAHPLHATRNIAVDGSGNAYVIGLQSNNAFKITPGGSITEIIDGSGDGQSQLVSPEGVAVDSSGNVFVTGWTTSNAFKITPGGVITEIIDATGDGTNLLDASAGIAVDGAGNAYVTAQFSDNVFKITPGGVITEIIDANGDGLGNHFHLGWAIAVSASGNVYAAGYDTDNVFKITPGGVITEIIDAGGDGAGNPLSGPLAIGLDAAENVYVAGGNSDNVFQIKDPGGANTIIQIIDATGDRMGNPLEKPSGIAVDGSNVYVSAFLSDNAFKIDLRCGLTYCDANPDNAAGISLDGCSCAVGSINVSMTGGPPGNFAYLLVGAGTGTATNPAGAQGDLCLTGSAYGGYVGDVGVIDAAGMLSTDILNANTAGGNGNLPSNVGGNLCAVSGQTWNFQYWHRDGTSPSNFSKALTATFH